MRSTYRNAVWVDNDGEFLGINLGADFCAEHEWGIKELKRQFGIDSDKMGIEKRAITKLVEDNFLLDTKGKYGTLIFARSINYYVDKEDQRKDLFKRWLPSHLLKQGETEITGAWDEGSFGIRVIGKENKAKLMELHKAIYNKDAIIMLGKFSDNPFENAGLMILIKSKLPKSFTDAAMEADLDSKKLQEADLATGIKAKLEKAGKRWMALSPRWIADARKANSKHPVQYWLNPFDQQNNEYGWYTVEELELWAQDKGPIIEHSKTFKDGHHPVQRSAS